MTIRLIFSLFDYFFFTILSHIYVLNTSRKKFLDNVSFTQSVSLNICKRICSCVWEGLAHRGTQITLLFIVIKTKEEKVHCCGSCSLGVLPRTSWSCWKIQLRAWRNGARARKCWRLRYDKLHSDTRDRFLAQHSTSQKLFFPHHCKKSPTVASSIQTFHCPPAVSTRSWTARLATPSGWTWSRRTSTDSFLSTRCSCHGEDTGEPFTSVWKIIEHVKNNKR